MRRVRPCELAHSPHTHTQAESGAYSRDFSRFTRRWSIPSTAIRSVPSLPDQAIAYRDGANCREPVSDYCVPMAPTTTIIILRVRRPRACSSQGNSSNECVCVFFPFILDIKFVGRTSRGHTGGRSHRISHPPSFCGACLHFSREKDSAIPFSFVDREVDFFVY